MSNVGEGEWVRPAAVSVTSGTTSAGGLQVPTPNGSGLSVAVGSKTVESRLPPPHHSHSGSNTPQTAAGNIVRGQSNLSRRESHLLASPPLTERQRSGSLSDQQPAGINIPATGVTPPLPEDATSTTGGTTSFGFERTLESEIPVSDCFELLLSVQNSSHLFREWSLSDLQILSQLMTVLKFSSGDNVIEAGEASSFVAILLSGTLEVRLTGLGPEAPGIVLHSGGLLGELSCFEGGTRTAEVKAMQDCCVAILTFTEIESLKYLLPDIRLKFMCMFALEGLKKLRKVLDSGPSKPAPLLTQSQPPTPSNRSDGTFASPPQGGRTVLEGIPGSPAAPPARAIVSQPGSRSESPLLGPMKAPGSVAPISTATGEKALLKRTNTSNRRSTMQNFSSMNLFGSTGVTAKDALSTVSNASLAGAASPRRMEAMFRKRGIENQPVSAHAANASATGSTGEVDPAAAKVAKHRLTNLQLVQSAQEKSLQVKTHQIESLTQDLARASSERKELLSTIERKNASLAKRKGEIEHLQNELALQKQHGEILERTVKVLESQVSGSIVESNEAHARERDKLTSDLKQSQEQALSIEKELKITREALNALSTEGVQQRVKATLEQSNLAQELQSVQAKLSQVETDLAIVRVRNTELQSQLLSAQNAQRLTVQQAEEMGVAQQQSYRLFISTSDRLSSISKDVQAYRKILRRVLVTIFVRNFRKKKQTNQIALELQEMLACVRTELKRSQTSTTTTTNTNGSAISDDGSLVLRPPVSLTAPDLDDEEDSSDVSRSLVVSPRQKGGSSGSSLDFLNSATGLRPTKAEKHSLMVQKFGLTELLNTSVDLCARLKPQCMELARLKAYWQETSNSFFERTIELKQQTVDLAATLAKEKSKLVSVRKELDQSAREHKTEMEAVIAANHPHRKRSNSLAPSRGSSGIGQRRQSVAVTGAHGGGHALHDSRPASVRDAHTPLTAHSVTPSMDPRSRRTPAGGVTTQQSVRSAASPDDGGGESSAGDGALLAKTLRAEFDQIDEGDDPASTAPKNDEEAGGENEGSKSNIDPFPPAPKTDASNNAAAHASDEDESFTNGSPDPSPQPPKEVANGRASQKKLPTAPAPPSSANSNSTNPLSPRRKNVASSPLAAAKAVYTRTPRKDRSPAKTVQVTEEKEASPPTAPASARGSNVVYVRTPRKASSSQSARGSGPTPVTLPSITRPSASDAKGAGATSERVSKRLLKAEATRKALLAEQEEYRKLERAGPKDPQPDTEQPFQPTAINPHLTLHHTYSQLALHSPSPYVSTHVVHGVLSSASTIYSQSRRQQRSTKRSAASAAGSRSGKKHTLSPARCEKGASKQTRKPAVEASPTQPAKSSSLPASAESSHSTAVVHSDSVEQCATSDAPPMEPDWSPASDARPASPLLDVESQPQGESATAGAAPPTCERS